MLIGFSIILGCLVSLMITANGYLGTATGSLFSLVIIHAVGLAASLAVNPLAGNPKHPGSRKPHPLLYISGTLGLAIVFINNSVFSAGGVVLTLGGMLAGQSLGALIYDALRRLRAGKTFPWKDAAALVLVMCGAAGIGIANNVSLPWILLSWAPGLLLMVQILMNAAIAGYKGQTRMLQISYTVGLAAILTLGLFTGDLIHGISLDIASIPVHILLGGGLLGVAIMTIQNVLLKKNSALTLVLGTYLGEFAMGIVIDTVLGSTFNSVYILGLGLVITGLGLQNIPITSRKTAYRMGIRRG